MSVRMTPSTRKMKAVVKALQRKTKLLAELEELDLQIKDLSRFDEGEEAIVCSMQLKDWQCCHSDVGSGCQLRRRHSGRIWVMPQAGMIMLRNSEGLLHAIWPQKVLGIEGVDPVVAVVHRLQARSQAS